jgi:hypothetical protein
VEKTYESDLICSLCEKAFSTKQNLLYHEKICETKGKKPICEFCEKIFTSMQSLTYHLNICKKKDFKEKIELMNELKKIKTQFNVASNDSTEYKEADSNKYFFASIVKYHLIQWSN